MMIRKWLPTAALLSLTMLPSLAQTDTPDAEKPLRIQDWQTISARLPGLKLLPGTSRFTFSMYGAPGSVTELKELVDVMRAKDLGNGFDPAGSSPSQMPAACAYLASIGWPAIFYSGGDMQIVGGRAVFGAETSAALDIMRKKPLFAAYQLGEWGYYLHNLSNNESWLKDVFGPDFDKFRHLVKPPGLAGYTHMPASKQECYDYIKQYFLSRQADLCGGVISVTGHSHYEAYAGEFGAACIGLEVGENIGFTQSKLAFARGAARRWQKPWSVQVSPWFGPSCTSSGPLHTEGGIVRGIDAGHSLSFYNRMFRHAWFTGAAMVTPENSIAAAFEKPSTPYALSPYGEMMQRFFRFTQAHDRGQPYTPVAILLDHLAGYNGYMDKPWGILQPTSADRAVRDMFDHQLFPGADIIHERTPELQANPEAGYLRPTPCGEIFDVQLSDAAPELLSRYPVLLLAGDITFSPEFVANLKKAVAHGSQLWVSPVHREALNAIPELKRHLHVMPESMLPKINRPAVLDPASLKQLRQLLPIDVTGDAIQYAVNRTRTGWAIELINNRGVIKKGDAAATIDGARSSVVQLKPRFPYRLWQIWGEEKRNPRGSNALSVRIGPGESTVVEFSTN